MSRNTTHPAWTTSGGGRGEALPSRRALAAQIQEEHAQAGTPISPSRANRLAVRMLTHSKALEAIAASGHNPLTYRDETGDTAVWRVLNQGGGARVDA